MLRELTKESKVQSMRLYSVSRIATKDVVMVEGGGEIKRKSKVFVMMKRERFSSLQYISFCR